MDSSKKKFLFMIAVFLTPVILGTIMFFNVDSFGVKKASTNYGILVHPARPATLEGLNQGNKPALKEETIAKKWTMVYFETENCDKACLDKLTLIKKVRLLTNEKMRRVRTLFVTNSAIAKEFDRSKYHEMVISHAENNSEFLKQFPHQETKPIYLIDPYGNIMMYYPQADLNAKKIIKDINRLLKYSQLG